MAEKHDNDLSLYGLVQSLFEKKILIGVICSLAFFVSVVIALLLPNEYKSVTRFLSVNGGQQSGMAGALAQFSGVAQLAGVSLPGATDDLSTIESLLNSRSLRLRVTKKLDLPNRLFPGRDFGERDPLRFTEEELQKMLVISQNYKTKEFEVSIETKEAHLSQEILATLLKELETMLAVYSLELFKNNQAAIEKKLASLSERLVQAQKALSSFQSKNKLIDPTQQSESVLELSATLYAQKIQLQVALERLLVSYSENDPRVRSLEGQLKSLDEQIRNVEKTGGGSGVKLSSAPELFIEYQNLVRDLEIAQKLNAAAVASIEQSKMSLNENQIFMHVIDAPLVADDRSAPSRALIVLLITFSGLFVAVIWVSGRYIMRSLWTRG